MKTRLSYIWKQLIGSFWFIPLSIVFLAILLAIGLVYLDSFTSFEPSGTYHYLFSSSSDAARGILSTIAGAMIGVAGTVFSITLVALTMASSQFGHRLLQNFMYDRINQIVLGSYIATFIYAIIVLRSVKSMNNIEFIPNISIMFAILLAIANIVLLVVYIHHTAVQIQADQVVAKINTAMYHNITNLANRNKKQNSNLFTEKELLKQYSHYSVIETVRTKTNGYLQAINLNGLLNIASNNNLLIKLYFRPGDFLIIGEELLKVYSLNRCDESIIQDIHSCFITGIRRTSTQDADFEVHQMVEIASRALSPGVNDPYTAINCIDNLAATVCYTLQIELPKPHLLDDEDKLRLITKSFTLEKLMDTSFNQIRQYGSTTPTILIRLMESFLRINSFAQTEEDFKVIRKHINMVKRTAERNLGEENDLKDLLTIYKQYENNN